MRKLIISLFILMVVFVSIGCTQKNDSGQVVPTNTPTPIYDKQVVLEETPSVSSSGTDDLSNELDSLSKEVASINTGDTGDVIVPISDTDLE